MLGLGVSLSRGGAPSVAKQIRTTYESNFVSSIDNWQVFNSSPLSSLSSNQTVDGVSGCLSITLGEGDINIIKGSVADANLDDNKDIDVSFDMYIQSSTGTGDVTHTFGSFTQNPQTTNIPLNTWTTVSFSQTLAAVSGGSIGFRTNSTGLVGGDVIFLKNYNITIYA